MGPFETYDRVVALGASAAHEAHVASMRRAFELRTGAFKPDDRWFESRSRAFWDDALTRQGFARDVLLELPEEAHGWAVAFARAHRGLFRVEDPPGKDDDPRVVLTDVVGGAAFVVDSADDGSRDALDAASGLFDARLVAIDAPPRVAILPGALYHPEDATPAILELLRAPRAQELGAEDLLDALLRMERSLRSLSRVKAAYAYRESSLVPKAH